MRKIPAAFFCLILSVLLLAGGRPAFADSNATDFENFSLGDVNGQNGWMSGHGSSSCPVYDVAIVPNTYGYASMGSKSLRISNAITCGSFNDMTFSPSLTNEAGETSASVSSYSGGVRQPYFEAQWDFASTVPGSEQPGLSVVASADRGDPGRMSWIQMEDTPTGLQVNFEDYQRSAANFVTTPIGVGLDRTVPHTLKMTIQFVDGASNDIVNVYLDGVLVHTGTTWEDYFRDFAGGIPNPVDSIMFRTAGTAAPATMGHGFLIDNFSSYSGPVPSNNATLHVVTHVVNDNGGTSVPSDFNVHVQQSGIDVTGSPDVGQDMPGEMYSLAPNTYAVSQDASASYTQSFSGDCDASGSVTLAPGDDKTCTITDDDIGGQSSEVQLQVPLISIAAVPDPLALSSGPGPVTYTYTVTNPGNVPLTDVVVHDDSCTNVSYVSGDSNGDAKLEPNETWTYTCVVALAQTTVSYATAQGNGGGLSSVDTAITEVFVGVPVVAPLIHVVKQPKPAVLPVGGGTVTYTYTVTNPGTVALDSVSVTDDACSAPKFMSGDTNRNSKLEPNETWTYLCATNLTQSGTNTAVASGRANSILAVDTALATVLVGGTPVPAPLIHVIKKAVPLVLPVGGGLVTYTYEVTDPSNVPLTGVMVADDSCSDVKFISGDTNGDAKLQSNETWLYTCRQDLKVSTTTTATVSGYANGITVKDISVASVVLASDLPQPPTVTAPSGNGLANDLPSISARVASLTSLGLSVHELVKLQNDGRSGTQQDTTVYYIGADGERHLFPNPSVYFSWYCDFSKVKIISAAALSQIPLGINVVYRPGLRLVKFLTDPKVYLVRPYGWLLPLADEATARAIAGPNWNKQVSDIDDTFYQDYTFGFPITLANVASSNTYLSDDRYPSAEMGIMGYEDPGMAQPAVCPVQASAPMVLNGWPFANIPETFVFARNVDQTSAASLDIRYLQELLSYLGPSIYPEARVTGNFGPATTSAVERFQKSHGVNPNGVVGPATRAALNTVLDMYR